MTPKPPFAITWFEQHGFNVSEFGTAANLANAKGIAVENLTHAGVAQSSGVNSTC